MRHWNYRLIRRREYYPDGTTEDYYAIHEVYYTKKGKPRAVAENPAHIVSETPDGIRWQLKRMRRALKRPVLDYEDIGDHRAGLNIVEASGISPKSVPSMEALIRINAEDATQRGIASAEKAFAHIGRDLQGNAELPAMSDESRDILIKATRKAVGLE